MDRHAMRRASPRLQRKRRPKSWADWSRTTCVKANFLELKFAAAPQVIQAVEKDLRLDERIVRWCLRKKPTMPYVPKIKVPKSPRAFEDE